MSSNKTIGELNGRWAGLFKVSQIITPIAGGITIAVILPWCIWVTAAIFSLDPETPRYSYVDAERDKAALRQEFEAKFDMLPPLVWQQKIKLLEDTQREIIRNQIKIITKLDVE